jgi:hypothetical protein
MDHQAIRPLGINIQLVKETKWAARLTRLGSLSPERSAYRVIYDHYPL